MVFWIQILLLITTGIAIIYFDLKERIIPNKIVLFLLVAGIFITILDKENLYSHIIGFFIVGGLIFLLTIITKGFGMGDVKYMFAIGLLLGLKIGINSLLLGFVLGGFGSGIMLVMKKVKKTDKIAFGPYLVIGSIIALLYSII